MERSAKQLIDAVGRSDAAAIVELRERCAPMLDSLVAAELPREFQDADDGDSPGDEILLDVRCRLPKAAKSVQPADGQPCDQALDAALIAIVRQEVFFWLAGRCEAAVRAFIHSALPDYLRQQDLGEDLWNETLTTGCEKYAIEFVWQGETAFVDWLCEIAKGKILDRAKYERRQRRDHRRQTGQPATADSSAPGPLDKAWIDDQRPSGPLRRRELSDRLQELLLTVLSPREYEAVRLYYFESMSVEQVAKKMETTEGNVKTLLWRARNNLRGFLQHSSERSPSG
jgi:RNA polymerase sigma factor (sigma-70 family)